MVIAGFATVVTLWSRTKALEDKNDKLYDRVIQAESINDHQEKTIGDLQRLREIDALVMAGLIADYTRLSKVDASTRNKLSELEKTNATVRTFFDQPLPAELICMLNESCDPKDTGEGGKGKAANQPAGGVQATKTQGRNDGKGSN